MHLTKVMSLRTHLLAYSVLINSPNRGHMCSEELVLSQCGIAGPSADEAGLSNCIVSYHHTLDSFNVWPLIVHIRICQLGPVQIRRSTESCISTRNPKLMSRTVQEHGSIWILDTVTTPHHLHCFFCLQSYQWMVS